MWLQRQIALRPFTQGLHLITDDIVRALPELRQCRVGLLHIFIQHTSASLTINENADPDVPQDLETALCELAPEDYPYRHTCEGPDDMPAHIKAALLGSSVTVPVTDGRLRLGTWQGVYLCEHRRHGGQRKLVLTLQGDAAAVQQ
ncbi:MAG: secondary thiamine-phosphate synthase enzyme YjbQ [Planctomycetia bacterium]|nr:secondary thiamine-phosphate synthase enzyme YjbQ [Planctomycetia bacterium]